MATRLPPAETITNYIVCVFKHFTLEQLKGFKLTFKLLKKEPLKESISNFNKKWKEAFFRHKN
jgi:hypothetical protein